MKNAFIETSQKTRVLLKKVRKVCVKACFLLSGWVSKNDLEIYQDVLHKELSFQYKVDEIHKSQSIQQEIWSLPALYTLSYILYWAILQVTGKYLGNTWTN